jgi:hypothetical protein
LKTEILKIFLCANVHQKKRKIEGSWGWQLTIKPEFLFSTFFFSLQVNNWLLRGINGFFGIVEKSSNQWYQNITLNLALFHQRIYVPCERPLNDYGR